MGGVEAATDDEGITTETIRQAAMLHALEYTEDEREQMVWGNTIELYQLDPDKLPTPA